MCSPLAKTCVEVESSNDLPSPLRGFSVSWVGVDLGLAKSANPRLHAFAPSGQPAVRCTRIYDTVYRKIPGPSPS